MQNKTITYLLLIVVLFLWGYIAYKIVGQRRPVSKADEMNEAVAEGSPREDHPLILGYRDPFVGTGNKLKANAVIDKGDNAQEESVSCDIVCYGILRARKNTYFLVQVDGVHYVLKPGEYAGKFRLLSKYGDSLQFANGKKIYKIKINEAY